MWISERVAIAYFGVLVVGSWARPVSATRRMIIGLGSVVAIAVIFGVGALDLPLIRMAAPNLYILFGYYLCGLLWVRESPGMESWLQRWDRRLLGADPARAFVRWPTAALGALELIYMATFLVVPAGLAMLLLGGHADLADRYWTMVLGAEFVSFGALALVQTRPPWAVEQPAGPREGVHGFVSRMVEQHTIGANTFPSGHVASAFAVAFAVTGAMPWLGAALSLYAAAIAVGTITGRYHYVMDAVAGLLLAIALWIGVALWM